MVRGAAPPLQLQLPQPAETKPSWRGSKRFCLLVVLVAVFTDSLFYAVVIPILPVYAELLHVSEAGIGFLFSSFAIASFIVTALYGWLADKMSRKWSMLFGLVVFLVSTLAFGFGRNFWLLLIARSLQGASSGVTWVAGMALLADVYPSEEQGSAQGLVMTVMGVGILVGPLMGGVLLELGKGKTEFPFEVMCLFIVVDGVLRMLVKEPSRVPSQDDSNGMMVLLKDMKVMLLCGIGAAGEGPLAGLEPLLPLYLSQKFNSTPTEIGALWSILAVSFTVTSFLVGRLSDRFSNYRYEIMAAGNVILAISLPALCFVNYWGMIFIVLVMGFANSLFQIPQVAAVNAIIETKYGGQYYGAGSALINALYSFVTIVAPLTMSGIAELLNTETAILLSAAVVFFYATIFILLTVSRDQRNMMMSEQYPLMERGKPASPTSTNKRA